MLKTFRYNEFSYKLNPTINYFHEEVLDFIITSLGGFTGFFTNGVGRRLDLPIGEEEITTSTHANINNKQFYFTRCYTNLKIDTDTLDKKQDVTKYAIDLQKKITRFDDINIELPLIVYYNQSAVFEESVLTFDDESTRDYGYHNCLIIKNKFKYSQLMFMKASFNCWQENSSKKISKYRKMLNNIDSGIRLLGYSNLKYDVVSRELKITKDNKEIVFDNIENEVEKIFLSIIIDINGRALTLNPNKKDPFDLEGIFASTYGFSPKQIQLLTNYIRNFFPKVQILVQHI